MAKEVIIIGSGLGALECGVLLSKQGLHVRILERQHQPGGCMQSYRRNGMDYDTGLHYVGGIGEGQVLHEPFKQLGLLSLPWQRLDPDGFDRVTIGGETFPFVEGYDNFLRVMSERFPAQKAGLQKYIDVLRDSDNDTQMHYADVNAWQWLNETFSDPLLIAVLSGTSLKMELNRDTLPLFNFAHGNASFIQSSWRLNAPGNVLVNQLVRQIESNGGEILCNSEVTELIERDGRLSTAVCKNGERYDADIFISDIHPSLTLNLIKESKAIKGIYRRRMTSFTNTFGMFTCSLRLDTDGFYANHNKFLYSTPSDVWDRNGILISFAQPAQIDILTPMLWSEVKQWHDTTLGRRSDDYKAFKAAKAQELMAKAETLMPGLRDAVKEIYSSTPLTWRDYNNAPEGNAYGIRKDFSNHLMTILTPRTPLPNLLLTGQSLMIHGIHGTTMTAYFTCRELGITL